MKSSYLEFLGCLIPSLALVACGADAAEAPFAGGGAPNAGSPSGGSAGGDAVIASNGGSVATGAGGVATPSSNGGAPVLAAGGSTMVSGAGGSTSTGVGGIAQGGAGGAATGTGGVPVVAGTEYTFTTGHFSVPPGSEVYKCQDFTNPFNKDIGIVQEVTNLTPGSHHMFAFVLPNNQLSLMDNLADCPEGGVEFHDYLMTSGSPVATITYPTSTGRIFTASNGLRLNVHLINTDSAPKDAYVVYKVVYVDPSTLTNKVASIFLNQVTLSVPPGMSTQSKTYTLSQDINLMDAASHMHKQGIHFVATTNTGQTLYDGTDWQEPQARSFDPPLHLASGTRITWACTYNNTTGTTLSFGESAASNEMCIFPGEFYNSTGQQITYQAVF
ncbi:MAG TPA: hypothetical protein VHC69_10920 [Polyangiaceae bacterium]|nr:hypothetical protein [Polyangiaceae bacterium]